MSIVRTNLRVRPIEAARDISYAPTPGITPNNAQDAIEAVQANIATLASAPPAVTPKAVNFAMSPYTVQPTDYLLEVDTTGGAVIIQTQAAALRNRLPFTAKAINANPNGFSVVRAGAELIDGMTSYPVDAPYDAKTFSPKLANDGYEVSS